MGKSNAVGTKLKVGTVSVGGLKSISGIEISAETIEVTDLGNTDGFREKLPGFKDGGEVSISGYFDGEDEGQTACYSMMDSGDIVDCSIIFPTKIGKTWAFKACLTKFATSADVDDAVTFEATLAVSGKPKLIPTVPQ